MKNVIAILFLLSLVVGCGESREEKATRAKTAAEAEAKAVAAAKFAEDWKVIEKAIRKPLKKTCRRNHAMRIWRRCRPYLSLTIK